MRNVRLIVSRQIGHFVNSLAQFKQVAMCPQSINAQFASASKHTLHASSEFDAVDDSAGIVDEDR